MDDENANQIVPAWQQPAPGDEIIQGMLKVRDVAPGEYLLADMVDPADLQWVWIWKLLPHNDGEQTRLRVRFRIQLAAEGDNPVMTTVRTASPWPWVLLFGRTGLFIAAQAVVALGFYAAGTARAWEAAAIWWPQSATPA